MNDRKLSPKRRQKQNPLKRNKLQPVLNFNFLPQQLHVKIPPR